MDLIAAGARLARGADFFLHILFGDGLNFVIGFRSVVDGAEGGVAFGGLCIVVAVGVVMVVMVVVVMRRTGFYNLLGHGFDPSVSDLAVFGGRVL